MKSQLIMSMAGLLGAVAMVGQAQEAEIEVYATQVSHRLSRYLTGACIEDVNHEIYGGLYSQMIFGESFQEPAPPLPIQGFTAYGGRWRTRDGELWAEADEGPKLICDEPGFSTGEVGVELLLPERKNGNAGLIVKVSQPGLGADRFTGYEIALDSAGHLVLGRHRQNWEPIRNVPCEVPVNQWITLAVRTTDRSLEVLVNGKSITRFEETQHPLATGRVGLRTWQREARFRHLWIDTGGESRKMPFELAAQGAWGDGVSGMWRALRRGSAAGEFALETQDAFTGRQSQRVTFTSGVGEIGIENQSLNRWGMNFVTGKPYEGYVWARAVKPTSVFVALESLDGSQVRAEARVDTKSNGWERLDFTLTPSASDKAGRFALKLKQPGSVVVGHAFLQPGEWGRFKGLPDRKDVTDALIAQGLTVLRYGGSMINHPEYRWKKMIGPRERRPPHRGTWYPHSSNGWGIFDFLNFCEAAGFLGIPAINMDETPQDVADFIEYVNGPADSEWGRRRAADGHPAPYRLRHLELGNEEAVNEDYWRKFKPRAEAIWAGDPDVILVVGDFFYRKVIKDPFNFEGGAVKTLAAHKKILDLAKERGREVWFDVHIGTEQPPAPHGLRGERSFIEQLGQLSPGAKYKVVIFEFNAGNHALKRALANACAINQVEQIGDKLPVACSANCLQPDGQNDNGWNQGLLFLNPSHVWLQPPGYVTRMVSQNFQPLLVKSAVQSPGDQLDVSAKRSEDGRTVVLQVVNIGNQPKPATIRLEGFTPSKPVASCEELAGPLEAVNTAENPERIVPRRSAWPHGAANGPTRFTFAPHSFTVLRFE